MRLHFGRDSERSRRAAMGRKTRGERRMPVSQTPSSRCTIGATPRRVLRFDPKTEQFPGDDEANALLTKKHREPWGFNS